MHHYAGSTVFVILDIRLPSVVGFSQGPSLLFLLNDTSYSAFVTLNHRMSAPYKTG